MPTVPVTAAGWRIEPPVSVPVAARQRLPDTAAAEPPEEPPGTRFWLESRARQGLNTGPKAEVSFDEPIANSSMLVLPSITAPASHRFCETVDSYGGMKLPRMWEPAVVRTPLVQNKSLIASGKPSSGRASPFAMRASESFAIAIALSGVSVTNALSVL